MVAMLARAPAGVDHGYYPARVPNIERADVVVVGAGLLGLCTADALRGRRDVVVLEAATVGHERAGSHGPSRVFRLGYEDPFYVQLAQRSLPRWQALEARTGRALLEPTGQLTFGPGAERVRAALEASGAPVATLAADQIAEQFPMFAGHGAALYEPASHVIAAADALDGLRANVEVRQHVRVRNIDTSGRVETDDGAFDANVVVVCAGPWTRRLFDVGEAFATLEHVAYFRPPAAARRAPIFIDFDEPAVYGLPTPGSDLYKLGLHHGGRRIDPDAPNLEPDSDAVDALRGAARVWLPEHELVDVDTCLYDNTPTEDFVIDRIGNVVLGCGTSGHGFKFGPLLGELVASLIEETEPVVPLDRFRIRRA
jgi:sarcosine oxidase